MSTLSSTTRASEDKVEPDKHLPTKRHTSNIPRHSSKTPQNNVNQKKRKMKVKHCYSKITTKEAEKILKIGFGAFEYQSISVGPLLEEVECWIQRFGEDSSRGMKERVYAHIVEYLGFEGYPGMQRGDFKEANVNDLVLCIIGLILFDFKNKTNRQIRLTREKELVSKDFKTGGYEEFVVVDETSSTTQQFVLLVESKRTCLRDGNKQCFLAMGDMWSSNGGGEVYGFVTTGVDWRMARYDGKDWGMTPSIAVLFDGMCEEKDRWVSECSHLVDFILYALCKGGNVKQDVVV